MPPMPDCESQTRPFSPTSINVGVSRSLARRWLLACALAALLAILGSLGIVVLGVVSSHSGGSTSLMVGIGPLASDTSTATSASWDVFPSLLAGILLIALVVTGFVLGITTAARCRVVIASGMSRRSVLATHAAASGVLAALVGLATMAFSVVVMLVSGDATGTLYVGESRAVTLFDVVVDSSHPATGFWWALPATVMFLLLTTMTVAYTIGIFCVRFHWVIPLGVAIAGPLVWSMLATRFNLPVEVALPLARVSPPSLDIILTGAQWWAYATVLGGAISWVLLSRLPIRR